MVSNTYKATELESRPTYHVVTGHMTGIIYHCFVKRLICVHRA